MGTAVIAAGAADGVAEVGDAVAAGEVVDAAGATVMLVKAVGAFVPPARSVVGRALVPWAAGVLVAAILA